MSSRAETPEGASSTDGNRRECDRRRYNMDGSMPAARNAEARRCQSPRTPSFLMPDNAQSSRTCRGRTPGHYESSYNNTAAASPSRSVTWESMQRQTAHMPSYDNMNANNRRCPTDRGVRSSALPMQDDYRAAYRSGSPGCSNMAPREFSRAQPQWNLSEPSISTQIRRDSSRSEPEWNLSDTTMAEEGPSQPSRRFVSFNPNEYSQAPPQYNFTAESGNMSSSTRSFPREPPEWNISAESSCTSKPTAQASRSRDYGTTSSKSCAGARPFAREQPQWNLSAESSCTAGPTTQLNFNDDDDIEEVINAINQSVAQEERSGGLQRETSRSAPREFFREPSMRSASPAAHIPNRNASQWNLSPDNQRAVGAAAQPSLRRENRAYNQASNTCNQNNKAEDTSATLFRSMEQLSMCDLNEPSFGKPPFNSTSIYESQGAKPKCATAQASRQQAPTCSQAAAPQSSSYRPQSAQQCRQTAQPCRQPTQQQNQQRYERQSNKYESSLQKQLEKQQFDNLVLDGYCPGIMQETIDGKEDFNDVAFNLVFGCRENVPKEKPDFEPLSLLEAFSMRIEHERKQLQSGNDGSKQLERGKDPIYNTIDANTEPNPLDRNPRIIEVNRNVEDHFNTQQKTELNQAIAELLKAERQFEIENPLQGSKPAFEADMGKTALSVPGNGGLTLTAYTASTNAPNQKHSAEIHNKQRREISIRRAKKY